MRSHPELADTARSAGLVVQVLPLMVLRESRSGRPDRPSATPQPRYRVSDTIARVYAGVGFARIGTSCIAEPAEPEG
jgi:hypothetical protein